MKLLLDTDLLVWAAARPDRLSPLALELIEDPGNEPMFSSASVWELSIKFGLGRDDFTLDPRVLRRELRENGYVDRIAAERAQKNRNSVSSYA